MTLGTLECSYELDIQGIDLPRKTLFSVPSLNLQATLKPGVPLKLDMRIKSSSQFSAEALADRFVKDVYQRFLLRFAGNISGTRPPRVEQTKFVSPGTPVAAAVPITATTVSATSATALCTPTILAQVDVDD